MRSTIWNGVRQVRCAHSVLSCFERSFRGATYLAERGRGRAIFDERRCDLCPLPSCVWTTTVVLFVTAPLFFVLSGIVDDAQSHQLPTSAAFRCDMHDFPKTPNCWIGWNSLGWLSARPHRALLGTMAAVASVRSRFARSSRSALCDVTASGPAGDDRPCGIGVLDNRRNARPVASNLYRPCGADAALCI